MNPIDKILPHLDKVRKSGTGYTACCPAHDDKNPSFAISEGGDGTVLMYCQAGCTIEDIVGSLGLTISDLYPDKMPGYHIPNLDMEYLILEMAKEQKAQGKELSVFDLNRVELAMHRITCGGKNAKRTTTR